MVRIAAECGGVASGSVADHSRGVRRVYPPYPLDVASTKALRFDTVDQIAAVERQVHDGAAATVDAIRAALAGSVTPIALLSSLKFDLFGVHPLPEASGGFRSLNVVEQINQTFSLLVALRAVAYLLPRHPGRTFLADAGAGAGTPHNIVSTDGMVIAECFAATHRKNNRKLDKDIATVGGSTWPHPEAERHVFFHDRLAVDPLPSVLHGDTEVLLHRLELDRPITSLG